MSKPPRRSKARPALEERWATLIGDDEAGIDRDIVMLLLLLREKYGYTIETANKELIRRLSFAS